MTYPIAEIFHSPQGEGLFTGAYFCFIRFAGCTVGKPFTEKEKAPGMIPYGAFPVLHPYQEKCTDWAGNSFACDTNYRMSKKMTVEEILQEVGDTERVCLTGGEPVMQPLCRLMEVLNVTKKQVHLETSGTVALDDFFQFIPRERIWITVSPKQGLLEKVLLNADELKILVDERFSTERFEKEILDKRNRDFTFPILWFQPINDENEIRQDNLQRCLELQKKYPFARISTQMHKLWRVR